MIATVRLRRASGASFRLWIPLFLVWPLVMVVLLPALVVGLAVSLVPRWNVLPALGGVWAVLCESRGVLVQIESPGHAVFVDFH